MRDRRAARISNIVASPWFTWVAALLGIVVFFVIRKIDFLSSRVPDEILETPTPAFIGVALVCVLWTAKLLSTDLHQFIRRAPKQIIYHEVQYTWIYGKNGDLTGTCLFDVHNLSNDEVNRLPIEGLVWYNKISRQQITFRILVRDGDSIHHFEEDSPHISVLANIVDAIRRRSGYHLSWCPRIVPPLRGGGRLLYSVDISTPRTEIDAFSLEGTCIGFPVSRFTRKVKLIALAPTGFKFVALDPFITVSDMQSGEARASSSDDDQASISPDGAMLTMQSEFPAVGSRYSGHFRLEKK